MASKAKAIDDRKSASRRNVGGTPCRRYYFFPSGRLLISYFIVRILKTLQPLVLRTLALQPLVPQTLALQPLGYPPRALLALRQLVLYQPYPEEPILYTSHPIPAP